MNRLRLIIPAVCALFLAPALSAQGPGFGGKAESFEPILQVDWAAFRGSEPGKNHLELYYQVYNFGLQFVPDGKAFVASYGITAVVFDNDGAQVSSYERDRQVRVATQAQTRSRYDYRTSQINLNLPPGKYNVKFALTDKGSSTVINRAVKVEIPDFKKTQPCLSSIEFAQSTAEKQSDSDGVFDKDSQAVVPSVSRVYSGTEDKRLLYYFDVYAGSDTTEDVVLETALRHDSRGLVFRDTVHLAMNVPVKHRIREIPIVDMVPGDYELTVTLFGRRMKKLDDRVEPFSIMWSEEALLKLDWKTAISQLSYIASSSELKDIKKAKTYEERKAAFAAFWEKRDPSAGTPENEFKQEFYRRINVANRHFTRMRREGWQSDRGRIFIIFGEPDQLDDEPYSPSYPPYQVWHYYREGRYRRFVFVDKDQDGDYRLQYPFDGLNQRPDF